MHKRKMKNTLKQKVRRITENSQDMFLPSFVQTSTSIEQVYHGARGRYHYFLCQQHLLRMQVEAMQKLWNLPPEFEVQNQIPGHTPLSLTEKPDRLP